MVEIIKVFQENHHPDKINKPKFTVPIPYKQHQQIHGTECNDTPLFRFRRQYDSVTKIIVQMKHWQCAYQKQFEEEPPTIKLKEMKHFKYTLKIQIQNLIKNDLAKVSHIKGLGVIGLGGILAYAHPSRFPSLRKFLFYCGYTKASHTLKRKHPSGKSNYYYNRRIPPIMFNVVQGLIKAKNPKYYSLYLKFKLNLKLKNPTKPKIAIHRMAINRTATFLLKEIYSIWSGKK